MLPAAETCRKRPSNPLSRTRVIHWRRVSWSSAVVQPTSAQPSAKLVLTTTSPESAPTIWSSRSCAVDPAMRLRRSTTRSGRSGPGHIPVTWSAVRLAVAPGSKVAAARPSTV